MDGVRVVHGKGNVCTGQGTQAHLSRHAPPDAGPASIPARPLAALPRRLPCSCRGLSKTAVELSITTDYKYNSGKHSFNSSFLV